MDIYNMVMKIPYILMLLTGVTLILQIYVGGLNTITMDIDQYSQDKFRSSIVLENTLSVQESSEQLNYEYDHRRAVIPIEFFTNELSSDSGVGYREHNSHCYIPKVAGLDGENFGFYIRELYDRDEGDPSTARELDCRTAPDDRSGRVYSPALLVRKANSNPPMPARLYIYEIE